MMRITIIGAGVAGLTAATELAERGHQITIIARSRDIGDDCCSWFAGGMLAPWCEGESAEEPVVRLGQQSLAWWSRHVPGVEQCGTLVLTQQRDSQELQRFARRTENHQQIEADRIAELEPDIAGRFRHGLFFEQEAHLNPRRALRALADKLLERGATLLLGRDAADARVQADLNIDCRGYAARDVLHDLRSVKGEMLVIRSSDINLQRPVRLLHPRIPLYLVPRGEGVHMVGATMIESEKAANISLRSTLELLSACYALHPGLGEAEIIETACDGRPAFADNLPRIRQRDKTIYINGLYRHGFLLSPVTAMMTADLISGTVSNPEFLEAFQ